MKEILREKQRLSQAILAMNVQSIQQIKIASDLANEINQEIIIQFSSKYIPYFDKIIGMDNLLNKYRSNPRLVFHLDHCQDEDIINKCINWGFDSVMYDGSSLKIDDNIEKTKNIVNIAHSKGVLVEGEVGIVGGVEDGFAKGGSTIFDQEDAIKFYEKTRIDMFALGIGNAHGLYKTSKSVNIELLNDFQKKLKKKALLVLHGATGLTDIQLSKAIEYGVIKVNFSTEFKLVYQETISKLDNNKLHDEIHFFEELKKSLHPKLISIINKLNKSCI